MTTFTLSLRVALPYLYCASQRQSNRRTGKMGLRLLESANRCRSKRETVDANLFSRSYPQCWTLFPRPRRKDNPRRSDVVRYRRNHPNGESGGWHDSQRLRTGRDRSSHLNPHEPDPARVERLQDQCDRRSGLRRIPGGSTPVSYTHLTLPTILRV